MTHDNDDYLTDAEKELLAQAEEGETNNDNSEVEQQNSETEQPETQEASSQPENEQQQSNNEQKETQPEQTQPETQVEQPQEKETQPETQPQDEFKQKFEAIDKEVLQLAEKFQDGEMDFPEYNQKLNELNNQKLNLVTEQQAANYERQFIEQQEKQKWQSAREDFFQKNEIYKDQFTRDVLDSSIQKLLADPNYSSSSYEQVLSDAHTLIQKHFNIPSKKPEGSQSKPDIPSGIGNMPAAIPNSTGEGKFDNILALKGEDLEKAVEKMTPEQEREFART